MMTKVMMTMLVVLAIRVESDCVRQVLRSSRKAGSRVHKSVQCASHSAQCAMHRAQCTMYSVDFVMNSAHCALYIQVPCSAWCSLQHSALQWKGKKWVEGDSTGSRSLVRQRGRL